MGPRGPLHASHVVPRQARQAGSASVLPLTISSLILPLCFSSEVTASIYMCLLLLIKHQRTRYHAHNSSSSGGSGSATTTTRPSLHTVPRLLLCVWFRKERPQTSRNIFVYGMMTHVRSLAPSHAKESDQFVHNQRPAGRRASEGAPPPSRIVTCVLRSLASSCANV